MLNLQNMRDAVQGSPGIHGNPWESMGVHGFSSAHYLSFPFMSRSRSQNSALYSVFMLQSRSTILHGMHILFLPSIFRPTVRHNSTRLDKERHESTCFEQSRKRLKPAVSSYKQPGWAESSEAGMFCGENFGISPAKPIKVKKIFCCFGIHTANRGNIPKIGCKGQR